MHCLPRLYIERQWNEEMPNQPRSAPGSKRERKPFGHLLETVLVGSTGEEITVQVEMSADQPIPKLFQLRLKVYLCNKQYLQTVCVHHS